jgi:hypothetical protein
MVMPELSILFTKKNKQNSLMERLVLQQVLVHFGNEKKLPTIRPQYTFTPKNQPNVSLNYRKSNVFFFKRLLYTETLNKK